MWPTVDGLRIVRGNEADLIRHAIKEMLEALMQERKDCIASRHYGIAWFDQWDVEQRIWLLEKVAVTLFLDETPPLPAAAIYEAAVDTIFCHISEAIEEEMQRVPLIAGPWRSRVLDAFRDQHGRSAPIDSAETDMQRWREVVGQIADRILGHPSYQRAEWFRDGDATRAARFLQQRGLPDDYLQRIPPLQSDAQTNVAISRIQRVLNLPPVS